MNGKQFVSLIFSGKHIWPLSHVYTDDKVSVCVLGGFKNLFPLF